MGRSFAARLLPVAPNSFPPARGVAHWRWLSWSLADGRLAELPGARGGGAQPGRVEPNKPDAAAPRAGRELKGSR
jgi:hypothetical protein